MMLTLLTMQNRPDTVLHLTINQKPNGDDFAKAREVIEIRGTGNLTLHDRRVMNILYANAGQKICDYGKRRLSLRRPRAEGSVFPAEEKQARSADTR
jgi:hypothetical protein